ncbi:MAG: glycosyltransferase [Acetobacteraceae bacterium]|nr:glycosyltransferase [Acetobacteraceae bacterium]
MRIAHVMAGARAGGAELFFERLSAAMHAAGDAVLPVVRRDAARAGRMAAAGVAPVELGFGGALDLVTPGRLRRVLREFEPGVVVAWMNRAARAMLPGSWVTAGRLGGYYDLRYYRRCEHLIGNTRGIVAWVREQGWPAGRVHHLPNFAPDLAGAMPARLPAGRVVLALGRLHRNKGFDVLIRAMAGVPEAQLVLAGDGPERGALRALAEAEGIAARVHLLGWRQDTGALLAGCDVLVCSSRHEPLGNVVIEAFSAGRPVVAAAVAGPLEVIDPGRTGLLVPPEDPARLAAAIRTVLGDPGLAAGLAAAGRAEWARSFAEAPVVARWQETLHAMQAAR